MGDLSENFSLHEFACRCGCGQSNVDPQLVVLLQEARREYGGPITITSGVRCEKHNREVGGSPDSSHLTGFAVDISVPHSHARYKLLDALKKADFRRLGLSEKFIHADIDPKKPDQLIWLYEQTTPRGGLNA